MKLANSICLFICCFIPSLVPSLGASLIILLSSCPLKHPTIPLLTIWKEQQPILPQKFQPKPRHCHSATALGMFQIPLIPPRIILIMRHQPSRHLNWFSYPAHILNYGQLMHLLQQLIVSNNKKLLYTHLNCCKKCTS